MSRRDSALEPGLATASVLSALPEIEWPAWPSMEDAFVMALAHQLAESQWWSRPRLAARQLEQADALIEHARTTVPFYASRLSRPQRRLTLAEFRAIPILDPPDLHASGDALVTRALPADHGPAFTASAAQPAGPPARTYSTRITRTLQQALGLRMAMWHRLDPAGKLAVIQPLAASANGATAEQRGPRWLPVFATGPAVTLDAETSLAQQLDWLARESPNYLQTSPASLEPLARSLAASGVALPALAGVIVMGHLAPAQRQICADAFRVPLIDNLGTLECGTLALRCPDGYGHHAMAEAVMLEVVDGHGKPCATGRRGRLIATVLHDFVRPLIRLDTGLAATAARACRCGRGLPALLVD